MNSTDENREAKAPRPQKETRGETASSNPDHISTDNAGENSVKIKTNRRGRNNKQRSRVMSYGYKSAGEEQRQPNAQKDDHDLIMGSDGTVNAENSLFSADTQEQHKPPSTNDADSGLVSTHLGWSGVLGISCLEDLLLYYYSLRCYYSLDTGAHQTTGMEGDQDCIASPPGDFSTNQLHDHACFKQPNDATVHPSPSVWHPTANNNYYPQECY